MRFNKASLIMTLLGALGACADLTDLPEDEASASDTSDTDTAEAGLADDETVEKAVCTFPSNYRSTIVVEAGLYGSSPECHTWCPAGSWITQGVARDEISQGSGDDTSTNAIRFACRKKDGTLTATISSREAFYGDWSFWSGSTTGTDPFVAFDRMFEPSQGSGDDTTFNVLWARTKSGAGHYIHTSGPRYNSYGKWRNGQTSSPTHTNLAACPTGTAACGFKTRVEAHIGGDFDDTSLNGLQIACCTF